MFSLLRPWWLSATLCLIAPLAMTAADRSLEAEFKSEIEPILMTYCFDCHGDGMDKGEITLDSVDFADLNAYLSDHELWERVWHNLRAQLMPPAEKKQPGQADAAKVAEWIERKIFRLDLENPDPGRVTVRRLNREEYRHTVADLLGVNYDTTENFPADDTGYGFDTIGDVLSLSPLLLEKYLDAAQEIAREAVPLESGRIPQRTLDGKSIQDPKAPKVTADYLVFEKERDVVREIWIDHPGRYKFTVETKITGSLEATENTAVMGLLAGGKVVAEKELGWDTSERVFLTGTVDLPKGKVILGLRLSPRNPPEDGQDKLIARVQQVQVMGPMDGSVMEFSDAYRRIMVNGPPPSGDDQAGRRAYAFQILEPLVTRAFRRPVDEATLKRLVEIALFTDSQPGTSFEEGIRQALVAVLASPRFLFRAELQPEPNQPGKQVRLDEYALASRLSYFLWSSLPDDRLMHLARDGKLRENLTAEVDRMLADGKSRRFTNRFVGQWLQSKDVTTINIDARRFLGGSERTMNRDLRRDIQEEPELLFHHVLVQNRPLTELLTADYTFLSERLADFYGIDGVEGREMRLVELAPDSRRGGVLRQASFQIVSSNPTRTSPVKRGLFVLENLLATPAPPAPPDVPALEAVKIAGGGKPTMREMMELHRQQPLCKSCHARMDPIGLALENYNAIGMWRDSEHGKPLDTAGQLVTGETFNSADELVQILARERRRDFYRCMVEKMLTYALGRGTEIYDAPTVDRIVAELEAGDGNLKALIHGVVRSNPFQMRRGDGNRLTADASH